MGSTRRAFTEEYRQNAVALVIDSGRSIAEVAQNIGISDKTLGKWVKQIRDASKSDESLSEPERVELERLRKETAQLRMDLEFAKKAAAWFAKGQQ
jgi:transposase